MKDASVIIPTYNSAICLEEAIDSALSQEWPAMEVIVINDGSTDATAEVARRYGKRIVYLEQRNLGQGAARNAGLRVARGGLIAFLDADDYWKPQFLKVCVQFLSAHPEAVAVSTGLVTRMFDGSEVVHPKELCGDGATQKEPFIIESFFEYWARFDHVRTGSNVIRHSVIKRAGPDEHRGPENQSGSRILGIHCHVRQMGVHPSAALGGQLVSSRSEAGLAGQATGTQETMSRC
jgi:glycosyltransferase involved in cell wall biosynthesis